MRTEMFDETKAAVMAEIAKLGMCIDPAPMLGSGTASVLKALKEDLKEMNRVEKYYY